MLVPIEAYAEAVGTDIGITEYDRCTEEHPQCQELRGEGISGVLK